jgi:hypothetical protein
LRNSAEVRVKRVIRVPPDLPDLKVLLESVVLLVQLVQKAHEVYQDRPVESELRAHEVQKALRALLVNVVRRDFRVFKV